MKRVLSLAVALVMLCALCCGCSESSREVDCVSASTSLTSSYLYLVEDEKGIEKILDIYDSLEYRATDEQVDVMGEILSVGLHCKGELTDSFMVTPDGLLLLKDTGDKVYRITSDFDYDELRQIIILYSLEPDEATFDEV